MREFDEFDRQAEREAMAISTMHKDSTIQHVGHKRAKRHLGKGNMQHGHSGRQKIVYRIFED